MTGGESTNDGGSTFNGEDEEENMYGHTSRISNSNSKSQISSDQGSGRKRARHGRSVEHRRDRAEQRGFMYCRYLHHPGIAKIQYKAFFHMCRL